MISDGERVFDNFGVLNADKLMITFLPEKSTYSLTFGKTKVETEVFVTDKGKRFIMNVTIENFGDKDKEYKMLKCCFPYLNLDESQGFSFYDKNVKMPYVIQNREYYGLKDFRLIMRL